MSFDPGRKGLYILFDGLGDRPQPQLDGRTPLAAAATPWLDGLANGGACLQLHPYIRGRSVSTHSGTALLFGVPPSEVQRLYRGPIEAAGIGLESQAGDVLLRCNFATLERAGEGLRVRDRRAGRIGEGTEALAALLQAVDVGPGIQATLRPATQHRAVLRLRGEGLSDAITRTDPGDGQTPTEVLFSQPEHHGDVAAMRTATAVNRFTELAFARLGDHALNQERLRQGLPPANGILTRGAGQTHALNSLLWAAQVPVAVVAAESTVIGLAKLLGFTPIVAPGATALANTDLGSKLRSAIAAFAQHDLVFLHIKATDILAHDHDPLGKQRFIERADAVLRQLSDYPGLHVAVASDHGTDSGSGCHIDDPVPALLGQVGRQIATGPGYTEPACHVAESLNCDTLLRRLLMHMGRDLP